MNGNNQDFTQRNNSRDHEETPIQRAAKDLLDDGKKLANEVYEQGMNKVNEAGTNVKQYTDDLLVRVKENPLASILIAGGIGFLLSSFLKK
ncbi:hypothetical protein [Legionella sp. MW5194]|uniref:hypothetical protein n=1 Tax=Legionella sp. MW5194 TaxID=2662448 RepID=UPI001EF09F4B|nr:hypothetical protein [Legionella sp. MW5194]